MIAGVPCACLGRVRVFDISWLKPYQLDLFYGRSSRVLAFEIVIPFCTCVRRNEIVVSCVPLKRHEGIECAHG